MRRVLRLLARVRELASRLAFWRRRQAVQVARALPFVSRELPALKAGEFLVRIPSVPTGFRDVYRGPSGAAARREFVVREASGRAPEFYDAPGGVTRRRA